jgi:hypothetical protein
MHHAHQRPGDEAVSVEQSVRGDIAHEPVQAFVHLQQQEFIEGRLVAAQPVEGGERNLRDAAVAQRDEVGLARRLANQRAFSEPAPDQLAAQRDGAPVVRRDRLLDQAFEHPEPYVLPIAMAAQQLTHGNGALRCVSAHLALR